MKNAKELKEKIAVFNLLNHNILQVEIDSETTEFFSVSKFEPADSVVRKTVIEGKNITDLISDTSLTHHYNTPSVQKDQLVQSIDNLKKVYREFSPDYKWIFYRSF